MSATRLSYLRSASAVWLRYFYNECTCCHVERGLNVDVRYTVGASAARQWHPRFKVKQTEATKAAGIDFGTASRCARMIRQAFRIAE